METSPVAVRVPHWRHALRRSVLPDRRTVTGPTAELVAEGRVALRRGDAVEARRAFELALAESDCGDVLEGLARTSYLELDFPAAIAGWQRAYAAHRDGDDRIGAVRVGRTLGYMYFAVVGDRAVMGGWIARAQTLLAGADETSEAGWVALNIGMFEGDRAAEGSAVPRGAGRRRAVRATSTSSS